MDRIRIRDEDIALMCRLNPLPEVVARTVDLTPSDAEPSLSAGRCPFCPGGETLRVLPEFWSCLSCGRHGNVVGWVRTLHTLDFDTAVQALAVRAGVPLNRETAP